MEPQDIEQLSAEEKKARFKDATVTHRANLDTVSFTYRPYTNISVTSRKVAMWVDKVTA
jgi:hypothetical protein